MNYLFDISMVQEDESLIPIAIAASVYVSTYEGMLEVAKHSPNFDREAFKKLAFQAYLEDIIERKSDEKS